MNESELKKKQQKKKHLFDFVNKENIKRRREEVETFIKLQKNNNSSISFKFHETPPSQKKNVLHASVS